MKFKLVEETNNPSPQEMLKNITDKFHSMTEENIISEVGGVVSTISTKSPMFIAPSGRFVDVGKATPFGNDVMHIDYPLEVLDHICDALYSEQGIMLKDIVQGEVDDEGAWQLDWLIGQGWIPFNTGSGSIEDRFYCILPGQNETRPSSEQWDKLERVIEWGIDNNKNELLAFLGDNAKTYNLKETFAEDIIKNMKRYYASGKVYESKRKSRMRFIKENYGYHYGDLDVAKKADKRAIMGGRGTGHFGTGFYMVGAFNPAKAYDYGKRACWEIDLDKYNMFKPKSNSQAYNLHDDLKEINKGRPTEFPTYEYFEENIITPLYDKYLAVDIKDIQNFFGVSYDKAFDMYLDGTYKTQTNEDGEYIIPQENYKKFEDELSQELDDIGILKYMSYRIDADRPGDIEENIKRALSRQSSRVEDLRYAVKDLSKIFGKDVTKEVEDALDSPNQEDSKSTVFMKSLGYEGIDVTHLNKDGEGLSGPDNFTYGSVIYDLKPGTYKKIKEKG